MNKKLLIILCSLVALFGSIYIASEHIAATKKANYNAKAFQYETVKIGEVIDYLETNKDIKYILVSESDNQDSDYLQQVLLHNLSLNGLWDFYTGNKAASEVIAKEVYGLLHVRIVHELAIVVQAVQDLTVQV